MIVRKQDDGELWLIGQTEHSRLVGELGARWGNKRFAVPEPYESIARAATYHDYGWLQYEATPSFDEARGQTPNFREIPAAVARHEVMEQGFEWVLAGDRYATLIVGMHRTGLSRARYNTITHPAQKPRVMQPDVEAFIAGAEARQEQEQKAFDHKQLWTNYRLLQVWDLLGLYFCCDDPYEDYIEPVPERYDDSEGAGVRMTLTPVDSRTVRFDPFPFQTQPCRVQLIHRTLPMATYPDVAAFRRAYYSAPISLMEFTLV
jgi:hypothetical protein